jgi:hypothetical protein
VIIICLKFIQHEALAQKVCPDKFIDWEYVHGYRGSNTKNMLGGADVWMYFLSHLTFADPKITWSQISKNHPLLGGIYSALCANNCMDVSGRGESGKMSFDDVCKLYILVNLEHLSAKHVTDAYTTKRLDKNTSLLTTSIMSSLADIRQTEDDYTKTFEYIFSCMHVDSLGLTRQIEHYRAVVSSQKSIWSLKTIVARKSRPSLRQILDRVHDGYNISITSDTGTPSSSCETLCTASVAGSSHSSTIESLCRDGSKHTLDRFCSAVRFPNSMSRQSRLRCYLLAAQGHNFDFRQYVSQLVPLDVATVVGENAVLMPDSVSISHAIQSISLSQAPFQTLDLFRQQCFNSFAIHQRKTLSLTQYLHLYVAAYQKRDIW